MLKPKAVSYQPLCLLSHDLINKVSVIVGHCDLLSKEVREGSEQARRLLSIREVAKSIAQQINQHQCEIEVRNRTAAAHDQEVAKVS